MKEVEFKTVKAGDEFESSAGSFIKVNDSYAKRTEDHWKTRKKMWRFSSISKVYVEAEDTARHLGGLLRHQPPSPHTQGRQNRRHDLKRNTV